MFCPKHSAFDWRKDPVFQKLPFTLFMLENNNQSESFSDSIQLDQSNYVVFTTILIYKFSNGAIIHGTTAITFYLLN